MHDSTESIVVEYTAQGLTISENPVGVMTNSPTFDFHLTNLRTHLGCSPMAPDNALCPTLALTPLGCGAGFAGIPGDASTTSRFIRATFARSHATAEPTYYGNVQQVFHILSSVAMVKGTVQDHSGCLDFTTYTACMDGENLIYYYKTYENPQISAVYLRESMLDGTALSIFPVEGNCIPVTLN